MSFSDLENMLVAGTLMCVEEHSPENKYTELNINKANGIFDLLRSAFPTFRISHICFLSGKVNVASRTVVTLVLIVAILLFKTAGI